MFNDAYGLTDAVLHGRKRQTRRIVSKETYGNLTIEQNPLRLDEHRYGVNSHSIKSNFPKYKVGEVIAVVQNYSEVAKILPYWDYITAGIYEDNSGWNNKMFVRADLMPSRIKITGIRCERLQDISDEDCLKEGIYKFNEAGIFAFDDKKGYVHSFNSAREAFASLIDKVSGKGTWERNPFVWVYEFELID